MPTQAHPRITKAEAIATVLAVIVMILDGLLAGSEGDREADALRALIQDRLRHIAARLEAIAAEAAPSPSSIAAAITPSPAA
ncbi:MAG: hypothetical protein KGI51_03520, partial [Rhodospirillales bacterium]|nr:hypothetical protein [Rhodospirillales bacterium]